MEQTNEKKWKRYEDLVAKVQRSIAFTPGTTVHQNERVMGRNSKRLRQLDITIRARVGQFDLLCVIDCKDHKRPIDLPALGSFLDLLQDVGAQKGAMVAAKGFTGAAIERARAAGVDLLTLLDAEEHEWQTLVKIPVIASIWSPDFRLSLETTAPQPLSLPDPPGRLVLRCKGGEVLGIVHNLILDRWQEISTGPGPHRPCSLPLTNEDAYIEVGGSLFPIRIQIELMPINRSYLGYIPLEDLSGFVNLTGNAITLSKLGTGPLSFDLIENTWKLLDPASEPITPPVLMTIHAIGSPRRVTLGDIGLSTS